MITEADIRRIFREELKQVFDGLNNSNPSKLLTSKDVEREYGIKRGRLYELHKSGTLFYMKEGRKTVWRESDVRSYANQLKKTS